MPLLSKSIQEPKDIHDGIRVCIMRKPGNSTDWDIWMPTLAPPLSLHTSYQSGEKTWDEYVPIFHREVIKDLHEHIRLLVAMAQNHIITVLCWEKTPEKCHRRLILEEAQRIDPLLTITIK